MAKPIKQANGSWQISFQDERAGIPRTKRTFDTRQQALEWQTQAKAEAFNMLVGREQRRTFGEALAKYLSEDSQAKKSHHKDISNARMLRNPIYDSAARRWIRLEETPLNDNAEGIVAAMHIWHNDMRKVVKRVYLWNQHHEKRLENGIERWYLQPSSTEGKRPPERREITSSSKIADLEAATGRGPYSSSTVRLRQLLVKVVLKKAYKTWRWIKTPLSDLIETAPPAKGRDDSLTEEQLRDLVTHAPMAVDMVILAGAWIGFRRSNIINLKWENVIFPVYSDGQMIQHGLIRVISSESKNGEDIVLPMSDRVEQLLLIQWMGKKGLYVFHINGHRLGDFRKSFSTAKRKAGLPQRFRFHDLRHTWASHLVQSGASDREIQELGNWKDPSMVKRYSHLRTEHLLSAVNRPGKTQ